jgi:hypothetical protein
MPVSNEYLQFVQDQLAGLGEITVKRMFGGAGLYLDGTFFAIVADDVLYFKVDDSNRPALRGGSGHAVLRSPRRRARRSGRAENMGRKGDRCCDSGFLEKKEKEVRRHRLVRRVGGFGLVGLVRRVRVSDKETPC